MAHKYERKDMGAWGDRQEEARLEKIAEATKTRKPPQCHQCRDGYHNACLGKLNNDRRICRCECNDSK